MKKKSTYQTICNDIAKTFVDIYYPEEYWRWVGEEIGGCMHVYHCDMAYYNVEDMLEALKFLPKADVLFDYNDYCCEIHEKGVEVFPKLDDYMKDPKSFPSLEK